MVWPFKKKGSDKVPADIQQYYQAERRERVGIAWLLGLATVVATLVVATGLYFGGRWIYRQIANRGAEQTTSQDETGSTTPQTPPGSSTSPTPGATPPPVTPTPPSPTQISPGPTPEPASTPTTGPLPRTGPESDE